MELTKERIKELKEERKSCNKVIKELAQEREGLRDIQRTNRVRVWRIAEILKGDIPDDTVLINGKSPEVSKVELFLGSKFLTVDKISDKISDVSRSMGSGSSFLGLGTFFISLSMSVQAFSK